MTAPTSHKNRLIILGIDAVDLTLVENWVREGVLPNFKKLLQKSLFGPLKSTIPFLTPPAWVSSYTGVNPGQHGVYDFLKYNFKTKQKKLTGSFDVQQPTFWQLLSKKGKKCVVVNAPVSFPPTRLNGLMVTGMMTPSIDSGFTYPKSLKKEILKLIPDFKFGPNFKFLVGKNESQFLKELLAIFEQRKKLFWFLWQRINWDLYFFVFDSADRIQHVFWKDIEKSISQNPIKQYYHHFDQFLGQVLRKMKSDDSLLIYSDHGMRKLKYYVYLNPLLAREGFVKFKKKQPKKNFFNLDNLAKIFTIADKLGLLSLLVRLTTFIQRKLSIKIQENAIDEKDFDWQKTKAWFFSHPGQSILINPRFKKDERSERKIKKQLITLLNQELKQRGGKLIIKQIYDGKKLYSGRHLVKAPDLVIEPAPDFIFNTGFNKPLMVPSEKSADHAPFGLYLFYSRGLVKKKKRASIKDIAPTVLKFFKIRFSGRMEGQPLF